MEQFEIGGIFEAPSAQGLQQALYSGSDLGIAAGVPPFPLRGAGVRVP
jgi:hypothetical protein